MTAGIFILALEVKGSIIAVRERDVTPKQVRRFFGGIGLGLVNLLLLALLQFLSVCNLIRHYKLLSFLSINGHRYVIFLDY